MQPSIPWSSSVSLFIVEMMAIIYSMKCTVPFSFAVPLLSLAVTHCHLLPLSVTRCITRCHSLYHSMSLVAIRCHSMSFVVTRGNSFYHSLSVIIIYCHSLYHSLSLVVIRCHSLSLDVQLVCLFISNHRSTFCMTKIKWF